MSEWRFNSEEEFANSTRGWVYRGVAAALFVALCYCSYKYNVNRNNADKTSESVHIEVVDDTSEYSSNDVDQTDLDL